MGDTPRTVESIYEDFELRRNGLLQALTNDVDDFYKQADPERENLCLYGETDGSWTVDLPAEEVPPELPEPCLGINFARDGMQKRDWLALVAVHSDSWLYAVAFYYGAKLDNASRLRLFRSMNQHPTLYEIVTGKHRPGGKEGNKRKRVDMDPGVAPAKAADAPLPTGRLLDYHDITPTLKGRQAELFWPDDKMWYLVEIHSVNPKNRTAKIQYTSGEIEELDLQEIIREGHMSLITQ
ncbi:hypothetical protein WJX75_002674 [Coccomyxa subellipsoidea]|uniref:Alfin N-terminal domain-containing protein n=1 Tax=Coccomyxa subellipsoidea TaxID=248742 RepID=A0ABR2YBL4_9CHLO